MRYDHTQEGMLYWLLIIPGGIAFSAAWAVRAQPGIPWVLAAAGVSLVLLAFMFRRLRVFDDGERLIACFDPIPCFRVRLRYTEMRSAEIGRTSWIDGWGIHWLPGRGTTINVWGFDCVRIKLKNGRIYQIGTDDPVELCAFLNEMIDENSGDRAPCVGSSFDET